MQVNIFIKKILSLKEENLKDDISDILERAINSNSEYKADDIKKGLKEMPEEKESEFGNRLVLCKNICDRKLKNSADDSSYLKKIQLFIKNLDLISDLLVEYVNEKGDEKDANSELLDEINGKNAKKLAEISTKIKNLDLKVDRANEGIDNKFFSLLINTVAILGIFVAIAFAGFGTISFLPTISFIEMFVDVKTIIQGSFLIIVSGLVIYNLLLLAVYFIFQLSRPLLKNIINKNTNEEYSFKSSMNLIVFYIIDLVFFVISLGLFITCLCIS